MSYTPTQWKAGDTVTSAKLNKMEQGIAGGANILIAHATEEVVENESSGEEASTTTTVLKLDKTAREILDADFTIIIEDKQYETTNSKAFMYIGEIRFNSETGVYTFMAPKGSMGFIPFSATAIDDYPVTVSHNNSSTPAE